MTQERCLGCGGLFARATGPVHRYMTSSPGCWEAFGQVLAAEYGDPSLLPVHRLSVDAYAVQHPGDGSRRAIQSVGLHLARLYAQLEWRLEPEEANRFMLMAGRFKANLQALPSPADFTITVADVAPLAGTGHHAQAVRRWARSSWEAWSDCHALIAAFAGDVLRGAGARSIRIGG
jgi:hypothetical protein